VAADNLIVNRGFEAPVSHGLITAAEPSTFNSFLTSPEVVS